MRGKYIIGYETNKKIEFEKMELLFYKCKGTPHRKALFHRMKKLVRKWKKQGKIPEQVSAVAVWKLTSVRSGSLLHKDVHVLFNV